MRAMTLHFPALPLLLLALLCLSPVSHSTLMAEDQAVLDSDRLDPDSLDPETAVRTGVMFERSRQWRDAIDHYKESLELWPDEARIQHGLRRARFHFSIDRRYDDRSFQEDLLTLKATDAFDLFEDLLDKIGGHFVESISTKSIVAHGTESLWLALGNDKFLERNLFGASPERIKELRDILEKDYWNKPCYREDARYVVEDICDHAEKLVGLNRTAVILEYVFGACNCLDDYSNVLTPGRLDDLYSNIEGEFVGIGIVMEAEDGRGMKLVNVLPDSPAFEAGLRRGEYLVRIDGVDCRRMTTDEAAGMLSGESQSQVRLECSCVEYASFRGVACTRRPVQVKSLPQVRIVDAQHGIGYIQMTGFQKGTATEMDAALVKLKSEGMQALIWDVRGNPGGLLTAAVEVLDRFIEQGVLVSTRGRTADQNFSYSAHRPGTWDVPIVLLIDDHSASASEIVAGAIRDHQRGTIVGRKSYGKWSVQSIYPARHSTGLRMTTAKFYSPHGLTHGKVGVKPHIRVTNDADSGLPPGAEAVDFANDPDIQRAIRVLQQKQTEYTQR